MNKSLAEQLKGENYLFSSYVDDNIRFEGLFVIYLESMKVLRKYPGALIMDFANSTNRLNRLILNIVGVHGSNTTIS